MPQAAPTPLPKPASAGSPGAPAGVPVKAPTWVNICWGIRNGAVDQSQFDPATYVQLQKTCGDRGYVGSCPPPAPVMNWLDQQRRAGTLPHISLSDSDIAAIPTIDRFTGDCAASWKAAGLAGYAPPWGDMFGPLGPRPPASSGGMLSGGLGTWAAIALGLAAVALATGSGRRR
jgi:hypothetical protein